MNLLKSFRRIFRNKTYSILNIAGLAIGIACAALILLWVADEVTYNKFPKHKQLYLVYQNMTLEGEIFSMPIVPSPLAAALKEEVAGIKNVMRYSDMGGNLQSLFTLNEKMIYEAGAYADSSIFSILDIEFVRGDVASAFDAAYPLVITEDMASRFFGKDDPIGESLKKDDGQEYQVTAVIRNLRKNSNFRFAWLTPFQTSPNTQMGSGTQDAGREWTRSRMSNYVELEASADVRHINSQIKDMIKQKTNNPDEPTTLFLYPISKLKLYGEFKEGRPTGSGYVRYVRLFFGIALVILILACINFMNLSTARSQKRVMEVGVRKTFGAKRLRLIRQFMSESGIITFLSLLLSIVLIFLLLPPFNHFVGKQLALDPTDLLQWAGLAGIGLVCTFVAGSYPAFFLSSFPPIDVLRKLKTKSGKGVIWLRQGLVVFQFIVSLTLIICTAFIYLQVQHAKNRSLGMNIEQVLVVEANTELRTHFEALKQELLATGVVEHAGLSSQDMLQMETGGSEWKWQGKPDHVDPLVLITNVTDELFPTLDITLLDGRNFDRAIDDNSRNVIINKAFADLMGEEGRIGGRIWQFDNTDNVSTIIGIINNLVFNDIFAETHSPLAFWLNESAGRNMFIRLKPGNMQSSLQKIETVVRRFDPNRPFEYRFMDEEFNSMFKSTLLVGKLGGLFAALAIFISCLGLFGLTAFAAEQRTREIGIRKVLGASVLDIVELLGRNFIVLTGISFVIAIPLAWWIMHGWLQNYEYRIGISWWVFAGSGFLVILIAMLTVSYQAIKAAIADPVKSIKVE